MHSKLSLLNAHRVHDKEISNLTVVVLFIIMAHIIWNSLPDELRDPMRGSDSFKQFLKTSLFSFY